MSEKVIRHFEDIEYSVVATIGNYHVDFEVYEIVGFNQESRHPVWRAMGAKDEFDIIHSLDGEEKAEMFMHGYVKWDGCSNWHFDEQDDVMLHFCDRESLIRIGEVMARCWDMAKELCSNFDT